MFGRTKLQHAIRVNLKQGELSLEQLGLLPLPQPWSAHNARIDMSDLFKVMKERRKLKRDLLDNGTMDRHLDLMLKTAINRDSICVGAYNSRPAGFHGGLPTPAPLPMGLPFFTNAMEADEFYYPKHLRGCGAGRVTCDELPYAKRISILPHHFVTRVLPKDAVPIEDMDYKAIPLVIREKEEVQKRLRAERVKHGETEYLQYIDRDTH